MSDTELKSKNIGDLVNEMIVLVVKEPRILELDYQSPSKDLYETYKSELNRREEGFNNSLRGANARMDSSFIGFPPIA